MVNTITLQNEYIAEKMYHINYLLTLEVSLHIVYAVIFKGHKFHYFCSKLPHRILVLKHFSMKAIIRTFIKIYFSYHMIKLVINPLVILVLPSWVCKEQAKPIKKVPLNKLSMKYMSTEICKVGLSAKKYNVKSLNIMPKNHCILQSLKVRNGLSYQMAFIGYYYM